LNVSSSRSPHDRDGGIAAFTLIELVIAIAIAGVVMLGLVAGFHEMARLQQRHTDLRSATILANDLMNEVRSKNFAEPNSPTNILESPRRNFDDVDDYNGWWTNPPATIEGVTLSNRLGFTEKVLVTNVWPGSLNVGVSNSTGFKRITVVVSNKNVCVSNSSVVSKYD
jgi:prepilin-type N-terminal cleavage/methylation domain-containing protein